MATENYKKQHLNSYTLGVYPTIELLQHKPNSVTKVWLSSRGGKNKGFAKILDLCKLYNISYDFNDNAVNKLSPKENTLAAAMFNKYESPIKSEENHIVLVNPQDMGNIGTLIRTMLAFEFSNLAIISPGVDIFHPKALRSSMGAVFQINFTYFSTLEDYQKSFTNKLFLFTKSGNKYVEETSFTPPFSLVFGNEADGLSKEQIQLGETVKLRQSAKVDSLNISVSAAIAMYQASK